MAGPWDFTLRPMALPSESLMRGAAIGGGIVDAIGQGQKLGQQRIEFQQAQQDRTALMQAQQAQAEKLAAEAAQFKADQERLAANPYDIELRAELAARYPKVYGSPDFKAAFDGLDKANQQQTFDEFSRVLAALSANKPDIAIEDLSTSQVAFEDAGRLGEAKSRAKLAEMIQRDPEQARQWLIGKVASIADKDQLANIKALDTREADLAAAEAKAARDAAEAQKAQAEADQWFEKVFADIGLTNEQTRDLREKRKIDWARLAWDKDKFRQQLELDKREIEQKARDLPPDVRKGIAQAVVDSRTFEDRAVKANDLAANFDSLPFITKETGGVLTTASEKLQDLTGIQAEEKKLNDDYDALRMEIARSRIPKGERATDQDVKNALKGMPDRTAKPEVKARFLRDATAELADKARRQRFDAQYQANNRGAGPATSDVVLDGVVVPRGTTQSQAYRMYVDGQRDARAEELVVAGMTDEEIDARLKAEGL